MTGVKEMNEAAERHGCRLILLAEEPAMYGDIGKAEVIEFPTRERRKLEQFIAEKRSHFQAIFSPTDTWGIAAAELRESNGFKSRITSGKLKQFRDKSWVQHALAGADLDHKQEYPQIVKPRHGTGSTGIRLVHNDAERKEALSDYKDYSDVVVQAYYQGPVYSAEIWSDGAKIEFFGITNRRLADPPLFLEEVKSFPHCPETDWENEVKDWIATVIDALDYDAGFAHVEFAETRHGFRLIELNARMPGSLITPAIAATTNYDPYQVIVDEALGMDPTFPTQREILGGYSHVSVYAATTGILNEVHGIDSLGQHPGNAHWVPSKDLGDQITDTESYRARVGNIVATGPNSAIAEDRVNAAARDVRVTVK